MTAVIRVLTIVVVITALALSAAPEPADAFNPAGAACSLAGWVNTVAATVCKAATHPGRVLAAGKKLLGGHLGDALNVLGGADGGVARAAGAAAGLAAIAAAAVGGARYALAETAHMIDGTTRPDLSSAWFSSSYWRVAGMAPLLTLPFLFAAALQALVRSDLSLLARAAFGYLPLALVGVGIAVPLTMLLLVASDQMSGMVASASGGDGAGALGRAGLLGGALAAGGGGGFLAILVAVVTIAGAVTLWGELIIRSAAVDVIVLMLPLFFSAMVWPARRVWAIRAVELLIALILSKFAIVAVLALGAAALGHTPVPSGAAFLTGMTLVLLAAFSPWALMRLLPLHELAGAAAGGLRSAGGRAPLASAGTADALADFLETPPAEPPDRLPELTSVAAGRGDAATVGEEPHPPPSGGGAEASGPAGDAGTPEDPGGDPAVAAAADAPGAHPVAPDTPPPHDAPDTTPHAPNAPPPPAPDTPPPDAPTPPAPPPSPPGAEEHPPGSVERFLPPTESSTPLQLHYEGMRDDLPPEVPDHDAAEAPE